MVQVSKARVFFSGRSQAVRIPAEFRFTTDEVYVRRDPQSGSRILCESPEDSWSDVFQALDAAGFPDDFMENRDQGLPQKRDDL